MALFNAHELFGLVLDRLRESRPGYALIKTAVENYYVDPNKVIEFRYPDVTYSLSLLELSALLSNRPLYGGRLNVVIRELGPRSVEFFNNHGAFVARPGEPTLTRLSQAICGELSTRELRIQALCDFVSKHVAYDHSQADRGLQVLQRPHEVLMRGQAVCGNKAVLLGSLLEQIGEDYLLVYLLRDEHAVCAVPQGAFPQGAYSFEFEGKTWVIVDPVVKGFVIGQTLTTGSPTEDRIDFVQRPSDGVPVNFQSGNPAQFRAELRRQ